MQFHASELNKTNQILMELPLFRNLMDEKEELEEHVNMLKHNIMYFESTNRKLLKKVEKLKSEIKTMKKSKKSKNYYIKQEKTKEDNDDDDDVVFINKNVATVVQPTIQMVIEEGDDHPGLITCSTVQIKANEEYDDKLLAEIDDELSVGQELGEHESKENTIEVEGEEEEEEGEEEVEVIEGEEEEEVEVIEGEEEEEEVEVVEGEEVEVVEGEEVEVVEEEEVEVVEEEEVEVVEGEEEEVEVVEGEEGEEEEGDEDVYEIEINGNTYYVSNEKDSVIYAADENGEITIEAGLYKNGKPVFH